jgi:uncharacterized protein YbjT (DUF2867 family)
MIQVTGSNGFVGLAVCARLYAEGGLVRAAVGRAFQSH